MHEGTTELPWTKADLAEYQVHREEMPAIGSRQQQTHALGLAGRRTALIFTDLYWPTQGGVAVTVDFIVDILRADGWRVGLIGVGAVARSMANDAIGLRTLNDLNYRGDQTALFSALLLSRRLRRYAADADLCILATPGRVGLAGLGIANWRGIPTLLLHLTDFIKYTDYYPQIRIALTNVSKLVFALSATGLSRRHGGISGPAGRRSELRFRRGPQATQALMSLLYPKASAVVALSDTHARALTNAGVSPDKVARWHSGVTVPHEWKQLQDRLRPFGTVRFLYVGRVVPEKNLSLLLHAFQRVVDAGIPGELVVAGDGQAKPELERLARNLRVEHLVRFLGDVPRCDLGAVYRDADVFVFPSSTDTQGLVLTEAAMFRLPLLTVDADLALGSITPAASPTPESLAERMTQLARNPGFRRLSGNEAASAAEQLQADSGRQLLSIVHSLIDARA